jgi:UDP-glucuronate 4-epimerase
MTTLITGHMGFIGRNLFQHLKEGGYDCVGIDIKDGKDILKCSLPSCDAVIHLAALAGVRKSRENPDEYWKVNVEGSKRIFEHAQKWHAKVLYASSSSAKQWYTSPYAATKKAVEALAPEGSIGMRFHTVYGLHSRPDMMYQMLINNTAKYYTNHSRDFTSIHDLVRAIELLLNKCDDIDEKYIDIGTGHPTKVEDLVKAAGRELPLKDVTGEQESSKADTTIMNSLGWYPHNDVLDDIKYDILYEDKMEELFKYW